ncbi:MAG: FG-GAP-like repeat-containing protein, partial [Candidatus Thorarchaeota archaeon]
FGGFSLADIDGSSALDMVVTVIDYQPGWEQSRILYLRNTGTNTNPAYSYIENYFSGRGVPDLVPDFATTTAVDLDNDGDQDLVVVNPYKDAGFLYYANDGTNNWIEHSTIFDLINSIDPMLGNLSKPVFHDMDGDGDLDLTVSSEKLYYFRMDYSALDDENLLVIWTQVDDFYKDINEIFLNTAIGQAAFSDFDYDGDFDITMPVSNDLFHIGFGGLMPNRSRLTYFENTGSYNDPVWEQIRTFYQPDFIGTPLSDERGYIDPQLIDLDGDGTLDMVLLKNHAIDSFMGSVAHNTFLAATYPFIHMVEIDNRPLSLGSDAFDSWDNSRQFKHWTYSITIADTDDDGIDEVIVGSYDSNIYAFEHVFNNTYRRAWRSPDMTHQDTRVVWDDVIDLVVGDQDQDGNEEIIAATDSRVIIFENVGNDQYTNVWDSLNPDDLNWTLTDIKAITVDNDLDDDGYSEIVIACDKGAYVVENIADNEYEIVWWWYAPGTPDTGLFVRTVNTGDPDNDGQRDIILGLTNETLLPSGEIYVFESMIRIFENTDDNLFGDYSWADRSQLYLARVHSVILTDHDSNGYTEIVIGSDNGICLLEWIADNQYGYVTHYSTPEPTYCLVAGNTDHDTCNEIIAGIGNNFTVFELRPGSSHIYDIVWTSPELPERTTDVAIGDTNSNNATEIVGTIAGGYTYCYDWLPNATELASLDSSSAEPEQLMNIRVLSSPSTTMITGVALPRKSGGAIS